MASLSVSGRLLPGFPDPDEAVWGWQGSLVHRKSSLRHLSFARLSSGRQREVDPEWIGETKSVLAREHACVGRVIRCAQHERRLGYTRRSAAGPRWRARKSTIQRRRHSFLSRGPFLDREMRAFGMEGLMGPCLALWWTVPRTAVTRGTTQGLRHSIHHLTFPLMRTASDRRDGTFQRAVKSAIKPTSGIRCTDPVWRTSAERPARLRLLFRRGRNRDGADLVGQLRSRSRRVTVRALRHFGSPRIGLTCGRAARLIV